MGGCHTCCQNHERQHLQNGHTGNSFTPGKTSIPSHSYALVPTSQPPYNAEIIRVPPQHPYSSSAAGEPVSYGTKLNTNSDTRKMFGQYPKLPPIRGKLTNVDAKRSSLSGKDVSESKIIAMFEGYKDPVEDLILADGIEKLCQDLNVRPEEFKVLVLAFKFDAETMCKFTRTEFCQGCRNIRADSIKGIQARFPDILAEVQSKQTFKDFYRWTYRFGLDSDTGQRTLPVDMAVSLWQLVFAQNEPPILKRWLNFLEWHPSIRGVPRDTWDMFLNFVEVVKIDLSNYDDTEAWPSLFDDFVEYENDCENQNVMLEKSKEEQV